jgi:hypothetical protein
MKSIFAKESRPVISGKRQWYGWYSPSMTEKEISYPTFPHFREALFIFPKRFLTFGKSEDAGKVPS